MGAARHAAALYEGKMPEELRAWMLRFGEDRTYRQIAAELGIGLATAHRRVAAQAQRVGEAWRSTVARAAATDQPPRG